MVGPLGRSRIMRHYNTHASRLTHSFNEKRHDSTGKQIPFMKVTALLASLREDADKECLRETGKEMDTYHLGDRLGQVRERFWRDERFLEAFSLLGLDLAHVEKAPVPWWNEIAATEMEYKFDWDGAHATIGPRHSLETQLARNGVELPISSVSVGGIVITSDNKMAIGLRAGASYQNTYHITAGALGLTDAIITGKQSIYQFFRQEELEREFGIFEADVSRTFFLSRIFDPTIDKGPIYIFLIRTNIDSEDVRKRYEGNRDVDKGEHSRVVFIPANEGSVLEFVSEHYKGLARNLEDRSDDERILLHPGALALLSYTNRGVDFLKPLFQEGLW
ncbi:MAG: hypothetical protein ABIH29_00130 [Candidatus Micrarchaeota archaeon]